MKITLKLLLGLFYLPFLALSFIIALILFIFQMTVVFTYNQSVEWKDKMILKADYYIKRLK